MAERRRILLVDDDPDILELYRELLGGLPDAPDVQTAESGEKALELISCEEFTAFIVDLSMPKMNGLQLVAKVRELRPRLPVAVLTALADPESERIATGLGVDCFLQKPSSSIDVGRLLRSIESLLTRRPPGPIEPKSEVAPRLPNSAPPAHEDLYPFLMGGLLHNALNTQMSLNGQLEVLQRSSPGAPINATARARLQAQVSHLGAYLRLMQEISRDFYAADEGSGSTEQLDVLCEEISNQLPHVTWAFSIGSVDDRPPLPAGLMAFVVSELLHNAGQACGHLGDPRVSLTVANDGRQRLTQIECSDNGPGLPTGILSDIQQQRLRAPKTAGTGGYGLFLVQELTTRLNGRFHAFNPEDGGACLRVLLPWDVK